MYQIIDFKIRAHETNKDKKRWVLSTWQTVE